MAKPDNTKVAGVSTSLATVTNLPNQVVPSEGRMNRGRAVGVSDAAEDNIVPFIAMLQKTSPQVDAGDDKYIDGANFGDLWIKNHPEREIVAGDHGIIFQPAHVWHGWNEWRPRSQGGGVVGRHEDRPADAVEKPNPDNPQAMALVRPNGNIVVETRNLGGFLLDESLDPRLSLPYMISLTSTGHTFYKRLNGQLRMMRFPNGERISLFDRMFRLTTKRMTNPKGTYVIWDFRDMGFVSDEQAEMGLKLYEGLESGALRAADPDATTGGREEPEDKDIPF